MTTTPDLKSIERFLLDQPGVQDASVWRDREGLIAHVTLHPHGPLGPAEVQRRCTGRFGPTAAPARYVVFETR